MLHPFPADLDAFDASDIFLVERILTMKARLGGSILVGLCGAQGSGKSHTAARLVARLTEQGQSAVALSIDDFYLGHADRQRLGRDVHPLLVTRGVPGTHDVALAESTLSALLKATDADTVALPGFDKSRDDRVPRAQWAEHAGRCDVVILEGWCVAATPEPVAALAEPVNALEADEDRDGRWRSYVNAQLAGPYAGLFGRLDLRILLRAPSFEQVFGWRTEQEANLTRTPGAPPPMDAAELRRFISHYERITRHILAEEPADLIIPIGPDRTPLGWRTSKEPS
jgi:D-glycerate 3-kinase